MWNAKRDYGTPYFAPDKGIQLEIQGLDRVGQVIYLSLQNED
ncbi:MULTISPECIES: hypothetical protein [Paenibacillus]|nr:MULTISPECIES: hypothetical protein [Paenibacillus]WJH31198.1 hypothetical protein N6H13_11920 [Paenibacillus sp. CC-CFT742]